MGSMSSGLPETFTVHHMFRGAPATFAASSLSGLRYPSGSGRVHLESSPLPGP